MPQKISDFRKEEFLILYNQGLNDYEISKQMNISDSTIFRWRRSFNLPQQYNRHKIKSKLIVPTQKQLGILCGILLGDASLQIHALTPYVSSEHGEKQKEYVYHLQNELSSLGTKVYKSFREDKRFGIWRNSYILRVKSNLYYNKWRDTLFKDDKKIITSEFLQDFSYVSLAYMYMDDGYFHQDSYYICTDCFDYESLTTFVKHVKDNLNFNFSIIKHEDKFRLRLSQYDIKRFNDLVGVYIINSLKYKLTVS